MSVCCCMEACVCERESGRMSLEEEGESGTKMFW